MIVANVIGGLGNQMFQYASGLALAHLHQTGFEIDVSGFRGYALHNGFELNRVFNISAKTCSTGNMYKMLSISGAKFVRRVLRRPAFSKIRHKKHIVEPSHAYWAPFLSLSNHLYLDGYWQSEKYFKEIDAVIRGEFTFKPSMNTHNNNIAEQIKATNSVSLHIRRGDYVSNPQNAFIGTCSLDYYASAIKYINSVVPQAHFFIFSDDVDWVKANLILESKHTYVDFNKGADSYNDMRLMSLSKHNIIANSSFSWWGAWLNNHSDKIVIAPKKWFASELINDTDLVPISWIRL
jgi:hypothetical protein